MKKKGVSIIIMAAALLILVVVYMAVSSSVSDTSDTTDTTEEESVYVISSIVTSEIENITFTNEGISYSFDYNGKEWGYTEDDKFPVDDASLAKIASALGAIEATRELDAGEGYEKEYGLESPLHKIDVKLKGGNSYTFKIGSYNRHMDSYYITSSAKEKVYMVIADFEKLFDVELFDMLLLEEMPSITASKVTKIEATTPGGKITLSVSSVTDEETSEKKTVYTHVNTAGGETTLEAESAKDIIAALTSLDLDTCKEYYLSEEDFALYGLDADNRTKIKISYTVEVSSTDNVTGVETKKDIEKEYTYYVGEMMVEAESEKDEAADTGADTTTDTGASDTDKEPELVKKTYVVLEGSNMIFEVELTGADAFFA